MVTEIENKSATAPTLDLRVSVPTDTASLKIEEAALRERLDSALSSGSVDEIIHCENTLKHFPSLFKAATARETRQRLNEIANELENLRADEKDLEKLRGERNAVLVPILEELERARVAVMKAESSLYQVDARKQNLLEERRELHKRLDDLKSTFSDTNADKQIGNNNNLENYFERV